MHRTTISIDEPNLAALHRIAEERQISVAAVIREAIEEKIGRSPTQLTSRGVRVDASAGGMSAKEPTEGSARTGENGDVRPPKPKSLGTIASGFADTARRSADQRFPPHSWR